MGKSGKVSAPSPYLVSASDNPGNPLISCLLNGENYYTWARAMKNALLAKNKLGFVDGTLPRPDPEAPEYQSWLICNSMVVAWIFNSLDRSLQASVAHADEAKVMWDDLKERFSQGNAPRAFQLKTQLCLLRQEGLSVANYYTKLKGLCDELDEYTSVPTCSCGEAAKAFLKAREVEKLYQFLIGLNTETYTTIRSQILGMDPLPSLSKAYSLIIQEERQRMVTLGREDQAGGVAFSVNKEKLIPTILESRNN